MRRIFITDRIQKIAEDYAEGLFVDRKGGFKQPLDNLGKLESYIRIKNVECSPIWKDYADYIAMIVAHYHEILVLHPSEFEDYVTTYFSNLSDVQLKDKNWDSTQKYKGKSFSDCIIECMRYKDVRSSVFPYIVKRLGIRACVYCNAQSVLAFKVGEEPKGYFQLDHFKPKEKYPFLCISFFNLQPCCANCNLSKSEKDSLFNLYTDDPNDVINPFVFSLDSASIVHYMLSQNSDDLDILFGSKDNGLLNNHNTLFHIPELYENFTDVAEEILWKSQTNNDAYLQQLKEQFSKLFPYHKGDIMRNLLGFYIRQSEIHKRPLTKLQQDIARQLKLL